MSDCEESRYIVPAVAFSPAQKHEIKFAIAFINQVSSVPAKKNKKNKKTLLTGRQAAHYDCTDVYKESRGGLLLEKQLGLDMI